MASLEELLAAYDQAGEPPLSTSEKVLGTARSYLAGPLFNFADNAEAGIASLFTDKTYEQELADIRAEQERYKRLTPYVDNAIEIGSGIVLNPFAAAGNAMKGVQGLKTARVLLTNPATQAGISAVGAADGEGDVLKTFGKGAAIGAGGAAFADLFGRGLQTAAKQADRLKLSAFGVNFREISSKLKKLGDDAGDIEQVPLLGTVDKAEKAGVISAGKDAFDNFGGVISAQDDIAGKLNSVLKQVDEVLPPDLNFQLNNTNKYILGLSGTARKKAIDAAVAERQALYQQLEQMNGGTLDDLQRLKIGLNYKWDQNPYSENVIKAMRSDLRAEIENRVNAAAKFGLVDAELQGSVRQLNGSWGELADLKDVFTKQLAKDYGGDVVEDAFRGIATTGGTGSFNMMAAMTGNPAFAALGAAANAARTKGAKNEIADILREWKTPLKVAGDVITGDAKLPGKLGSSPAPFTARSVEQMYESLKGDEPTKAETTQRLRNLLGEFDAVGTKETPKTEATNAEKAPAVENVSLFQNAAASDPVTDQLLDAVRQVESGGGKYLKSPTGPVGPYQFTKATGKAYGLNTVADRMDETKSRKAAAQLLRDEYGALGDLSLALLSYNQGRPVVLDAIDQAGSKNLQDLIPFLTDEGANYVPAIYAAIDQLKEAA